ncbi:Tegument protein VP13/14 [Caprine alphaherpesvirus 1]|uniref:Tegument protein UL47 n=1 Tax=Caprine alphaherpesvirus 1 TaxID=39944 RepID=A0AAF1D1Z2_9ALPH|nr:Tegument protein VP13/14 [Caprine alphaherpesvirus 1]QBM10854.1 Tegument protein VP13/14 [Caprine alphaherpesvirus 1]
MDAAGVGAPMRHPRRSGTCRAHPFERPRPRRSLLESLRAADAAAAERPRAPRPRPDFQRPSGEETSEDEDYGRESPGDYGYDSDSGDSDFDVRGGADRDSGGDMETEPLPGHDPEAGAAPQDYLTHYLRAMEATPATAAHRVLVERAARRVYARQFPPHDPGPAAPARRARRGSRGPRRDDGFGSGLESAGGGADDDDDADLREDAAPDAAYASLDADDRLPDTPWLASVEAAAEAAEDEATAALFAFNPAPPAADVPLPRILEGQMRPRAFFARAPLDVLCRAGPHGRAMREQRAWDMSGSSHGLLGTSWGTVAPEFSIGGMYVSAPEASGRRWLVWRRAMKQAMALQYHMTAGALCQGVESAGVPVAEAASFLMDALLRVGRNCHFSARPGRAAGAARRLHAAAAGPLAAAQYTPPDAGPRAALFRGSLGALIYWPHLRAALPAVPAVCARRAGAALQGAEVYLLALAHAKAPGYTADERCAASAYLSLFVALAERMLRWIYLAGAHLLGPHPTAAAFREVRARVPYDKLPLGSETLHDAEAETVAPAAFQAALESCALAQAYGEAYVAVRTSATLLMAEYATHAESRDAREATAAFLGVGLLAQRLLGGVNLLFNCLAGAAVYGGRRVSVREGTLARYSLLADTALPLVRPVSLVEFWEARDGLMRELRLQPVAGRPAAGKQRIVELIPSLEGMDALVHVTPLGARPVLGPLVDIAEALADFPHLVTGDGRGGRAAPR